LGRQQIYPTPYALMSANVADSSVTSNKLAVGSVNSAALSRNITLGVPDGGGSLDIYGDTDFKTIRLTGDPGSITLYGGFDGLENIRLSGGIGELLLFDNFTNDMTVRLSSGAGPSFDTGGSLELFSSSALFNPSTVRARLSAGLSFGQLDLFGNSANPSASYGVTSLRLNSSTGNPAVQVSAGTFANAPSLSLYGTDGLERIRLGGTNAFGPVAGELRLYDDVGHHDTAVLSATVNNGGVLELRNAGGARSISANGDSGQMRIQRSSDGADQLLLGHFGGGFVRLNGMDGSQRALLFGDSAGGSLQLNNGAAVNTVRLTGDNGAGTPVLSLNNSSGIARANLFGANTGGSLQLNDSSGAMADLSSQNGSSSLQLREASGTFSARLRSQSDGGSLALHNHLGFLNVDARSQFSAGNTAAWVGLNDNGAERISFAARNGATGAGGLIGLRNASGVATVLIAADDGAGRGRVTTSVLQITGGADLSEQFDVGTEHQTIRPGMVVCIDPEKPGKLVMSAKAYDRTVAGIVSGAGGVSPGMLMGQQGTVADGKHPVALTGRVYCLADANHGAIHPGDLLTTSETPGHAMKVSDQAKAQGAILGKAMGALGEGTGLVLVLVSLQ
jgi:hypothetical protein